MKIFLTGGTGFIGSHFINILLENGIEVVCLRRVGSKPRIKLNIEPFWLEGNYEDDYYKYLKDCDVFVHLASHSTNVPYDTLENCLHWNLIEPMKLFNSALKAGIKKYIITGTGFEYGQSALEYERIPVSASLKPTLTYAASKAASSVVFYQWALENDIKLKYLRIFQVFGNGEHLDRLWPSLKKAAQSGVDFNLSNGEQVRNFTPVESIVKDLFKALNYFDIENGKPLYKNLGCQKSQTVKEFAEYWWKKWDAKGKINFGSVPYRKNDVMRFVPEL